METRLFEWADEQGIDLDQLAGMLGYSTRQLYRIKNGEYPVTDSFRGRVILALGDVARSLFLTPVSEQLDIVSKVEDDAAVATEEAPACQAQ